MKERLHVIIVDDEPKIRRGIARMVEQSSPEWNVLNTFANGVEALNYIKSTVQRIDLLITDVKMPEMDGLKLIQELKAHQDIVPLVISGYDDFAYVRTALKEGVIDYILKPVDRQLFRAQLQEIQRKLQKKRYAEQIDYFKRCMAGMEKSAVTWLKEGGTFRLCCLSFDEPPQRMKRYTERYWNLLYYAVLNIVEEWVHQDDGGGQSGRGWVWQESHGHTWMLLQGIEEAERLADAVRASVNRYLKLTVTVSVGSEFADVTSLPDYRDEVLGQLFLRLIFGGNRVYSKEEMLMSPSSESSARLQQFGERLRVAIVHDEESETVKLLQRCLDDLAQWREPGALEQAVQYFILQMMSVLSESDHKKARAWMLAELNDLHDHTSSFAELRKRLLNLALQASAFIRRKREQSERMPVNKAKAWIQAHLTEPLTIQSIAEQIPMNPTYFCEQFKLQTGETVHDYLTRQRMKAAAALLIRSELKMHEIAAEVGYKDVKYFSRQFRKYFGVLPSRYKELYE